MVAFEYGAAAPLVFVQASVPESDGLDEVLAATVAAATHSHESDMHPVTVEDLRQSRRVYVASMLGAQGMRHVGFLRHVGEDPILVGDQRITITEIGSMWVDPEYRHRNIAAHLLQQATHDLLDEAVVPVAICNSNGFRVFSHAEYRYIGNKSRARKVVARASAAGILGQDWPDKTRRSLVAGLQTLRRFETMDDMIDSTTRPKFT